MSERLSLQTKKQIIYFCFLEEKFDEKQSKITYKYQCECVNSTCVREIINSQAVKKSEGQKGNQIFIQREQKQKYDVEIWIDVSSKVDVIQYPNLQEEDHNEPYDHYRSIHQDSILVGESQSCQNS